MNNEKYYLEKIEKLNKRNIDLKNSKEYIKGKDIYALKDMLKKYQFNKLIEKLGNRKKRAKISHAEVENGLEYEDVTNKPKIVVYTCVTGNYDNLVEPFIEVDNIDYVFFTDNEDLKANLWKVRNLPNNVNEIEDNILRNRYIKFHPYEIFKKDYDYAIYIDGNIEVISDLTPLAYCTSSKTGLALHEHRTKNSIFNEVQECKMVHKGNYEKMKAQVDKYEEEGFPRDFGLYECCIIVIDLKNETGKKILDDWWNEFIESKSFRDQLSFPYVVWKNGYKFEDIGSLGKNAYRNSKFSFQTKIHNR